MRVMPGGAALLMSELRSFPSGAKTQPFHDCDLHGADSGAELFVVEGESAAKAVSRRRDARFQAVLAMQGKPLNAWKASETAVANNPLFQRMITVIGTGPHAGLQPTKARFKRIVLLCDPDADGIHCNVLLLLFFYRWMRPLLDLGRLAVVRPPQFEITISATQQVAYAYSKAHHRKLREAFANRNCRLSGTSVPGTGQHERSNVSVHLP